MPQIKLIIREGGLLTFDVDGFEQDPNQCENVIRLLESKLAEQGLNVEGLEQIRHPASMRRIPQEPTKQINKLE